MARGRLDINQALALALLRVRPAPLAAFLKKLMGVQRVVADTRVGKMWLDPVSDFGTRAVSAEGYEPGATEAVIKRAANAKRFVDLGANEGWFSIAAARVMGNDGRVIAVEPQTRLAAVLARNIALNGLEERVRHISAAVSDNDAQAELYLSSDMNTGATSLIKTTRYRLPTETIRTITLPTLLREAGWDHIDFLKIDIEGWCYEVLAGAQELLAQRAIGTIYIEFHPSILAARGHSVAHTVTLIARHGYRYDGFWSIDNSASS